MPPEERALLAAIIASPDDDAPRLAYADWLDENADALPEERRHPARVRAELIRNQIASDSLIYGERGWEERYEALRAREWVLVTKDTHSAWESELEGVTPARGTLLLLARGLYGEAACTVKYFVERGAALLDAAPVTAVRLKQLAPSNVKSLATCAHFRRVRTLKMYAADTTLDAAASLFERVPLGHLRGLALDNGLANHGSTTRADPLVERVAGCAKLANLRRLNLYAAGVGEEGGRALAASPHLANLEVLDLRMNSRLGGAAKALRKTFGKRVWITQDDLTGFPVGCRDRD